MDLPQQHRDELQQLLRRARELGLGLGDIRALLHAAGWKDRQILAAFRGGELGVDVPSPPATATARDTFLHLLAFAALYAWVVSLVMLVFHYVDLALPDPAWIGEASWRERRLSAIRQGMATIVVAYPAFLVLWRLLLRELERHPEKARAAPRRWLCWLSIFVGTVTLAADVITLVYFLFEGEQSLRFVLKVAALFAMTGFGMLYLLLWLRTEPEAPS